MSTQTRMTQEQATTAAAQIKAIHPKPSAVSVGEMGCDERGRRTHWGVVVHYMFSVLWVDDDASLAEVIATITKGQSGIFPFSSPDLGASCYTGPIDEGEDGDYAQQL